MYKLEDISRYAAFVAEKLSGQNRADEAGEILEKQKKWDYYQKNLKKTSKKLQSVRKNVLNPSDEYKQNLADFAFALALAAAFLTQSEKQQNEKNLKSIDLYCSSLINFIKGVPQWEEQLTTGNFVAAPQEQAEPVEHVSSSSSKTGKPRYRGSMFAPLINTTAETEQQEVKAFLEHEIFKDLESYYEQTLKDDRRSHSYFCGLFSLKVEKAEVLRDLINNLKVQKSMGGVKEVLDDFYAGKGKVYEESGKDTDYEILNKGQNITTRLFGLKTTTIDKIDNLYRLVTLDNSEPKIKLD